MKAYWKGLLFMVVVVSFIAGSPLLSGSNGLARAVAAGFEVSGYINPNGDSLSSLYFVGKYTDYDGQSAYFTQPLNDSFPANESTPFSFTAYTPSPLTSYTILAIHDQLNDGVTVGSNTIAEGSTWDSLFGTQYTQQTFASLLNGSYINFYLEEFYANHPTLLGTSLGNELTMVNFSEATYAGTAYASNVPLPASLLLFGPGLAGLAVLRRRFKK